MQVAENRIRRVTMKKRIVKGVLTLAVAVIVLKLMGYDELSLWAACSVCLIVVLYWLCWLWLQKKY